MKFEELALDESILAGVAAAGFEECTTVQSQAIPLVLEERDVAVQSQTGTGKTAAFLLPVFQLLRSHERFAGTRVLIIAPTRELAVQIKEECDLLAESLDIRSAVFYGGVGYEQQQRALREGVEILVGTPGRLIDLNQSGHFDFREIGILVIDEADRLFDMGFYPDLRKMLNRMRPRAERLNMLFSATLSVKARNIAWEHMNDPAEIEIEPEHVTVDRVEQTLYHVAAEEKLPLLLGLFKKLDPKSAIVFTNTKKQAEIISKRLELNGYPAEYIIGDLPQKKRLKIINRIKNGESEFLVATDVAARGLHINDLDLVVNYDIPEDPEAYVHRIGRTARAGASGRAVSLACQRYVYGLEAIESLIDMKIPVETFGDELLAEDESKDHFIRLENEDRDDFRRGGGRGGDRRRGGPSRGRSSLSRSRDRQGSGRDGRDGRDGRERRDQRDTAGAGRDGGAQRGEGRRSGSSRGSRMHHEDRRRHQQRTESRQPRENAGPAPRRGDSVEERLAYYRKKYGEDFQPTDEMMRTLEKEAARGGRKSGGKKGGGSRGGGGKGSGAGNDATARSRGGDARKGESTKGETSKGGNRSDTAKKKPRNRPAPEGGKKKRGFFGRLFGNE